MIKEIYERSLIEQIIKIEDNQCPFCEEGDVFITSTVLTSSNTFLISRSCENADCDTTIKYENGLPFKIENSLYDCSFINQILKQNKIG